MDNSYSENIVIVIGILYLIYPWIIDFKMKYKLFIMSIGLAIVLLNLIIDNIIANNISFVLMLLPMVLMRFKFNKMIKEEN
jgi:hypothetical protein